MRNYLLSVAAKLPHLKTIPEVFPKQIKLEEGKIGNGIGKVAHSPIDAVKYLLSPANS